jgi:hypothetical protein
MPDSKPFQFTTVVWGPWHTSVYLEVNLPSLLAAGNLQAFAALHKVVYRIYTSRDDVATIKGSAAFQRARQIVEVELLERAIDRTIDPIAMHHLLWRKSIDEARDAGHMVLFIPPDVVWSNGAFRHIAEHAAAGKRAIFMTYMRVVSETAVLEAKRLFLKEGSPVLDAPSRPLVQLAMRHIHPLTLTYVRDSTNFPIHPEFVLWPVDGEGYLMRVLVREMFAYDPRNFDLNRQQLPAHKPAPDEVHYINDSDDLFALSLAPLRKDLDWYERPRILGPLEVASWWLKYDSPANDLAAAHRFYVHVGERTPSKWRRAELESDALMRRLSAVREMLRLSSELSQTEFSHVGHILAVALAETKLALLGPPKPPLTIVIPPEEACRGWIADTFAKRTRAEAARELMARIADHVIMDHLVLRQREEVLRTASGGRRKLTWRDGRAYIDGVAIKAGQRSVDNILCCEAMGVLPPTASRI